MSVEIASGCRPPRSSTSQRSNCRVEPVRPSRRACRGLPVDAGLADRLVAAVELGGSLAPAVAQESVVEQFSAPARHDERHTWYLDAANEFVATVSGSDRDRACRTRCRGPVTSGRGTASERFSTSRTRPSSQRDCPLPVPLSDTLRTAVRISEHVLQRHTGGAAYAFGRDRFARFPSAYDRAIAMLVGLGMRSSPVPSGPRPRSVPRANEGACTRHRRGCRAAVAATLRERIASADHGLAIDGSRVTA